MICTTCQSTTCIRQVPLFTGLAEPEVEMLDSITESRSYEKGSYIFREGEPSDSLFVVNTGLIKLTQGSGEGKQHIIRFLFPGDYFGQFALLQNKHNYLNAEVVENALVCRMHRDDFLPLLARNAKLAYSFLLSMSEQLQEAEEWAGAMHMLEADKRLAKMLLYLYTKLSAPLKDKSKEQKITLPAAKKEMASMIGTTAETLSRKLGNFEALNMIRVHKRVIEITNLQALQRMAEA